MIKNKRNKRNKVIATSAMLGATIAMPTIVDAVTGEDLFGNTAVAFDGGLGTVENPYLISTRSQLESINNNLAAHYKLNANINLGNTPWTPIASTVIAGFTGTLDGNNKTISGLKIDSQVHDTGLFRSMTKAVVRDLTIDGVDIAVAKYNVGALVGTTTNTSIQNVHVKNFKFNTTGTSSSASVGGIVGQVSNGVMKDSTAQINFVNLVDAGDVGGIIGYSIGGSIKNVYAEGVVSGRADYIGGIVGAGGTSGLTVIEDAVSNVDIRMADVSSAGGIVGRGIRSEIYRSIAYGAVVSTKTSNLGVKVGGIVGTLGMTESASYTGKLRYVYAFNKELSTMKMNKNHVAEKIGTNEAGSMTNIYGNAYEIIPGNAGSYMVGDIITKEQVFTKQQYEQFGFDFENIWTIEEGVSAPKLKIAQNVDTTMSLDAVTVEKYSFAGGSGTAADPYLVANVDDFKLIKDNMRSHFKLTSDIDFNWIPVDPIGDSTTNMFQGTVDGGGYKLKNVRINSTEDYVGVFGYINAATIRNLSIENVRVASSGDRVGALAGYAVNSTLNNISVEGEVNVTGADRTGGMIGEYSFTKINPKSFYLSKLKLDQTSGTITGADYTGGLIGQIEHGYGDPGTNKRAYVDEVFVNANVVGETYVGGYAGSVGAATVLRNAVIAGTVLGKKDVSGIGSGRDGIWGLSMAPVFENIMAFNSVAGKTSTSTNIAGGFSRFSKGTINGVFLYNNSVSTGKAGTISRSYAYDEFEDPSLNKNISNLYQFETILGGAPIGFVSGIATNELAKSKTFYESKSTMDFGNKWLFNENGYPTLAIAPKQIKHTFTEQEQTDSKFAGGSGTVENPFLISTSEHLKMMAGNEGSHFKLANDIDMAGEIWTTVIGATTATEFTGSFDGDGYTIKDLYVYGVKTYQGMFGYVGPTGKISNINFDGGTVLAMEKYNGFLVGKMEGKFENVTISNIKGQVTSYFGLAAGMYAGVAKAGTDAGVVRGLVIKNSSISGGSSVDYIGGAFGTITAAADMENIFVDAEINGGDRIGIFAGQIAGTGNYKDIMTMGNAKGVTYVGGYAGSITAVSNHSNIMIYADSVGSSSTTSLVGGFAGSVTSATSKLSNIYVNSYRVTGTAAATTGKFIGKVPTGSSFNPMYINVFSNMLNGHSTKVNNVLTAEQLLDEATYLQNGMTFDENSNWVKPEAGLPTLKINRINLQFGTRETPSDPYLWGIEEVDNTGLYVTNSTNNLEIAATNKNMNLLSQVASDINKIPEDHPEKARLKARMEEVRTFLNADAALKTAEATYRAAHLAEAEAAIALVEDSSWKGELQTRTTVLKAAIANQSTVESEAKALVEIAEATPNPETIAAAAEVLNTLNFNGTVEALATRLATAEAKYLIEAELVKQLEFLEFNIASKTARINYYNLGLTLNDAANTIDVTPYSARVDQAFIDLQVAEIYGDLFPDADALVVKAEKTPNEANLSAAQDAVTLLPAGKIKDQLQVRLDTAYEKMGVTAALDGAIKKTQGSMARADYDLADVQFKKLTLAVDLDKYKPLMANLLLLVESAELVTVAEAERTKESVDPARTKINATPKTFANWTVLDTRLKAVEAEIANATKVAAAEGAVIKAESTILAVDLDTAQGLVTALPVIVAEKKAELNARLTDVRNLIVALEAFKKAEAAVVKAEGTILRVDFETAQALVTPLATSTEKDALQERLDALNTTIEEEESKLASINDATVAVELAESTKTTENIDIAQGKITELPASDLKDALQERLDKVKADKVEADALADAAESVVKAETTKADADAEMAQEKVTALNDSVGKTALQERLDKLKADKEIADKLAEATAAVVKAEASKADTDINDAQTKVTALKDSPEKDALQVRLDKLKSDKADANALTEATAAVVKSEGSKTDGDINDAQTKVTALKDSPEKDALQVRIDKIKADKVIEAEANALDEATKAVVVAEGSKTDGYINDAQTKVTALKDSPEKDALQVRIDKIMADKADAEKLTQTIAAVVKAEGSKTDADINDAQTKVTALKDSPDKDALQERINKIKADKVIEADANALNEATAAVVKAEGSKALVDIDAAQTKVTALKASPEKDALQVRIDKLKAELANAGELEKATQSVDKAEITRDQEDADTAKDLVSKLTTSPEKDALQKRLDDLQVELDALAEATTAVVKAEGSKTDADIATAQTKVTALKDSSEKDALQERINKIEADKVIEAEANALTEATKAVVKAEGSKTDADINDAQMKVTALKDSPEKAALQERIDKIEADKVIEAEANALTEATKAVVKAEGSKTDADIATAQTKVTALKDSSEKDALQERINKIKADNNTANKLAEATASVVQAEIARTQVDIYTAQGKVTALPASDEKDALQERIDALNAELNGSKALDEATKLVEKAEGSKTDADIANAQTKVDALTDGEPKQALQERIDKIKADKDTANKLDEATKLVEKAEGSKTDADITNAQTKVDALTASPGKDALQDRLDAIKDENDKNVLFQTLMNEVKGINKNILDDVIKPTAFPATKEELALILKSGEVLTDANQKAQLKTLVDATLALMNLVDKIEGGDKSIETINTLPTSKIKDKYLVEHAEKDSLATAEVAVKKAEDAIVLSDIENAEKIVANLAPSDKKEEFAERLKDVRDKYNEQQLINRAIALVEQAESTKRITDIERAEDIVKQLKDGDVKTELQERLSALRKGLDNADLEIASKAVEKAEELKTNVSIGYAKEKVNGLRPSAEKTALIERIGVLEKTIYDQAQMDRLYKQAVDAVITAENSSIIAYLSTAIKLVGKVSDVDVRKKELVERINAITLRNQIAAADTELVRLELRPSQSGAEKVQGLITNLPDSVVEKEAFQTRLDAVKLALDNENYAKALKGVVFAESAKIESKRAAYYAALPLVAVLIDGNRKDVLSKRLADLLKDVEAYENLDGDYEAGDSIVLAAESIKDAKVKPLVLAWAKAVEDAEKYNSNALLNALVKAEKSIPQELFDNPKYKDLLEELTNRSSHLKVSSQVFSGLVARGAIKNAYVAILVYEKDRTAANKKAAENMIKGLERFKGHELQVEKLFVRIDRIEVVKNEK